MFRNNWNMNLMWCLSLLLSIGSCRNENNALDAGSKQLELTIHGLQTRQTIQGFGASDAWSCQFVGKNWPVNKRNQIADWLFSTEMDQEHNPKGIGLSIWRFNIGAGSADQGAGSGIIDEWRRAESFMSGITSYNWNQQSGQQWFLKAAKSRGVDHFIGFVNSPPVYLTKNKKAFSSDKNRYNLPSENYQAFANFLAQVAEYFVNQHSITLNYISPFNEPQWDWIDGGQEGSPAQNEEVASVTRVVNQVFQDRSLSTKLELPETAQLNYLFENDNKPGRGEQIFSFFNPSSPDYLGNLSHVASKVAAHSYYTTWPLTRLVDNRKSVKNAVENNPEPLEFSMSEYCLLEDNDQIKGSGRDLSMNPALYMARVIYADLVLANASSWQWWLAVSPYDYKDGLIYIDKNENDGALYDSKMLWVFGNFSRFVDPGMKRVMVSRNDGRMDDQTLDQLMSVAFISDDKQKCTVVLVNNQDIEIPVRLRFNDMRLEGELKSYITNDLKDNNLAYYGTIGSTGDFLCPPRSVLTLTNLD